MSNVPFEEILAEISHGIIFFIIARIFYERLSKDISNIEVTHISNVQQELPQFSEDVTGPRKRKRAGAVEVDFKRQTFIKDVDSFDIKSEEEVKEVKTNVEKLRELRKQRRKNG